MIRYKEGQIIRAKVTSIKHYGAFIETINRTQGLIHISEIANAYIVDVNYYLKVGEIIEVKILSIKDDKINATLNFGNGKYKKANYKLNNKIKNCNFKYGFSTLSKNLDFWKNQALKEIKYNFK